MNEKNHSVQTKTVNYLLNELTAMSYWEFDEYSFYYYRIHED